MTEAAAEQLAATVRTALDVQATVVRYGHYFIVDVAAATGPVRLYDDVDWRWLRRQLLG